MALSLITNPETGAPGIRVHGDGGAVIDLYSRRVIGWSM
jgi:hypothetical protein